MLAEQHTQFRRMLATVIQKGMFVLLPLVITSFCTLSEAEVISLNSQNFDSTIANSQVVFVNFYADWCRFSQNLKPVFEEASKRVSDTPDIVFASVDSDREQALAQRFHVSKYPTLKVFRFGELIKKEYRGQRSVDALVDHVKKQLDSKLSHFTSQDDLESRIDKSKRNVVAHFTSNNDKDVDYGNFMKAASTLRDDCSFWLATGDWVQQHIPEGMEHIIQFRNPNEESGATGFIYTGPSGDYDYLKKWLADKCVPLVREITFENAEELTEEGIPFLILFRSVGDKEAEKLFSTAVVNELGDQKNSINCLIADGKKFGHPLHHLGKGERDLPLVAIDSFRHMYLFPDFPKIAWVLFGSGIPRRELIGASFSEKGLLRRFVMDLHSGKLHREFHHGPDPTQPSEASQPPPDSVFKQLKPSENRYSLLNKQEL